MDNSRFAVGDLVTAKFGRTVMTVIDVVKGADRYGYRTSWATDGEQQTGTFPEDALELARATN